LLTEIHKFSSVLQQFSASFCLLIFADFRQKEGEALFISSLKAFKEPSLSLDINPFSFYHFLSLLAAQESLLGLHSFLENNFLFCKLI
jgi:hypothetical protein